MKNELAKLIQSCRFKEAVAIFDQLSFDESREVFFEINDGLELYGFMWVLLKNHDIEKFNELAESILTLELVYVESSYQMAFFHVNQMLKANPSLDNKLELLFYYNIPERILNEELAYEYAKEILSYQPDSLVAKMTIDEIEERGFKPGHRELYKSLGNNLTDYILNTEFEEADRLFYKLSDTEQQMFVKNFEDSLCIYGFIAYEILIKESAKLHKLAALALRYPLGRYTGAHELSQYHEREARRLGLI